MLSGEAEKLDDFRLNWKSLAQPAILPLFTDYLPDVIELQRDYDVVNDYNVILDPGEKSFAKFEELVSELVNQRLIQEFQLIINVNKEAYQSYSRSKEVTLTTTKKVPQNYLLRPDEDKKKEIINHFYILTMGHRIQCFDYTVDKKPQVRVTQYRSKNAVNDDESSFTYHYEIWVPQIQEFQTMTQTFYQFPNPEYKWSKTDNILCGAVPYDGVDDGTKVKRHRYCVIPDKMDTIEDVNNYYTKLNQLIEFLNKYCDETIIVEKDTTLLPKSADIHHLNDNRSDMTLTATVTEGDSKAVTKTNTNPTNDKNNDMINTEGKGMESKGTGITSPRNTSERSSENTSVPTDRGDYNNSAATIANLYHNSSKAYSFARLFLPSPSKVVPSKPPINPTVSGPVSNSSNTGSVDTDEVLTGRKTHWIYLKYDNTAYTYRSFHLEIHWIVCDSWVVDDFISTLFRRCARIGIRIAQTPEFFCSANLNMHPLRVQPHIEVPYIDVPYSFPSPIRLIERLYFCRSNDWIFDSEQATDWKARGLLVPSYLDRDRDFLDNTSNADDDSLITSIPVTGSRVGNGYSPQMKAVNDKFNASVTSAVRRAPSLSSLSKSLQRFVFKQDDDSEVKGSGQLGNFSSSPSGTKKLPSNHSDRQYLYCNALAAVRVAAQGFVWLHHATAKVSDLNTSREEKKTLALAKLQELQNVSHAIVACYDVIIWLVEKAMSHDKNRIKSSDSLAMDEGLRDDTVPLRRTPSAMSQDSDSGFDYQNNDSIDRPFSDSPGLLLRSRSQSQDGKPEEKEVVEAPSEIKDAEENVGIAARAIRDNTTNSSSPSHGPRSLL